MEIIIKPRKEEYQLLLQRPHKEAADLNALVSDVLQDVRKRGDAAILDYELKFDHVQLQDLQVTTAEIQQAESLMDNELKTAIRSAHENITCFHQAQRMQPIQVQTAPGVSCSQKSVPIQKVGLYIPGGTAPLFSTVLMLATPARIAGCQDIILCSPPNINGHIHPAILYAAKVAGVNRIYKCGGVQAIAALAYGTESIPRVSKIFGPGNQYVTCAKQQVSLHDVAIDMPAGPSEVAIIADNTANPVFVAADMLSQAEHGRDSQAILFTDSEILAHKVFNEVKSQLKFLHRKELAAESLSYSKIFVLNNISESFDICNEYAPEHLILAMDDADKWADRVVNAGSVFLGHYSCESAGDYASGTNHTLPTSGYAKAYSGVNLDSFCRKITFQKLTVEGIRSIGRTVEIMAEAEGLDAHRNAMTYRINQILS